MSQLLRSQRNDTFKVIQNAGLDPAAFVWETRRGQWSNTDSDVLVHSESGGAFMIDRHEGAFKTYYVPGEETTTAKRRASDWAGLLRLLSQWLENLKREMYAPNLWARTREGAPTH